MLPWNIEQNVLGLKYSDHAMVLQVGGCWLLTLKVLGDLSGVCAEVTLEQLFKNVKYQNVFMYLMETSPLYEWSYQLYVNA
jgi:hypothetical protein